jgi:hypothetical protein
MPRLHLTSFVDVVISSDEWSDQARCLDSIRVATPSAPSPPLLLHRLRSERPRRRRTRGLDIETLHGAFASLGGSPSQTRTLNTARGLGITSPLFAEAHAQDLRFHRHRQHTSAIPTMLGGSPSRTCRRQPCPHRLRLLRPRQRHTR